MKIEALQKSLYGRVNKQERKKILEQHLEDLSIDERMDLIDFYQDSVKTLNETGTCSKAQSTLKQQGYYFPSGSYSREHQLGSLLVNGELRLPKQDIAPENRIKQKRKKRKKANSCSIKSLKRVYPMHIYLRIIKDAKGFAKKTRKANLFMKKMPEQVPTIEIVYEDLEKLLKDPKIFTVSDIKNAYSSGAARTEILNELYIAGEVLYGLPPKSLQERLKEENVNKTKRGPYFTPQEKSLQKRASRRLFGGGSVMNGIPGVKGREDGNHY